MKGLSEKATNFIYKNKIRYVLYVGIYLFATSLLHGQADQLHVLSRLDHEIRSFDLSDPDWTSGLLEKKGESLTNTFAMASDGQNLYWMESLTHCFFKGGAYNAQSIPIFADTNQLVVDIEVDALNGHLYWLDHCKGGIWRSDLDGGSTVQIVSDSIKQPIALAINAEEDLLFWTDLALKRTFSSDLRGQNIQTICSTSSHLALRLFADKKNHRLYFTNNELGQIGRINFNGDDMEILYEASEDEAPFGLFVDSEMGHIYWTDYLLGEVRRMKLDGTEIQTLVSGLNEPLDLVSLEKEETLKEEKLRPQDKKMASQMSIFPNPSYGLVTIQLSQTFGSARLQIYDTKGLQLLDVPISTGSHQLDASDWHAGRYICRIKSGEQLLEQSFILLK
ncbi:MAG: T9SS type A sorting domain-containing protein [Bacteroidota bacterium]